MRHASRDEGEVALRARARPVGASVGYSYVGNERTHGGDAAQGRPGPPRNDTDTADRRRVYRRPGRLSCCVLQEAEAEI